MKESFKTLLSFLKKLWDLQPLTIRGWLVTLLSIAAIVFLAIPENDLIAWILGGSALALVLTSLVLTSIARFSLSKSLKASANFDHISAKSKLPVYSSLNLKQCHIWPWLNLVVERKFKHSQPSSPRHELTGGAEDIENRKVQDAITFPHRGVWQTEKLALRLSDTFGFCRYKWQEPLLASVEVKAAKIDISPLPVIAASSKAGDQMNLAKQRSGDLFDIKPYQPSDGTRRIMWKTYARNRQLVVRRPEPAILPDGEVAIFLVAGKEDDHVAGAFQSYLEQLDKGNIQVLFGTDGFQGYTSEPEKISEVVNQVVWLDQAGSGNGFGSFLESVQEADKTLAQVIVFCAEDSLSRLVDQLVVESRPRNIRLTMASVPQSFMNFLGPKRSGKKNRATSSDSGHHSLNSGSSDVDVVVCEAGGVA
jgi:hypothetical protein